MKIYGKYANLNKFKVTQSVEFFSCPVRNDVLQASIYEKGFLQKVNGL